MGRLPERCRGRVLQEIYRWFNDVGYSADIQALREVYPELTNFETYLRRNGWEGAQPAEQAG